MEKVQKVISFSFVYNFSDKFLFLQDKIKLIYCQWGSISMKHFIENHKFNFRQFTLYSTFIKIANRKVLRGMLKAKNVSVAKIITFLEMF